MCTPCGACGLKNSLEKSRPLAFQCSITWRLSSICIWPTISANVRKPISAISSRTSSATKKKKLMTCSGWPTKRMGSTGAWGATPTGQVLRWHLRIMMQPAAISGAVEKPNSSAPRSAPTTTSRPVRMPPSTCTPLRPRRRLAATVWWGRAHSGFPRGAGMLDRGQRRRAGAAFEARDGDVVGARLGDAGRNRADAHLGDELHRHQTRGVDVLQVEDELRQILDRIDVVVRGRRDEADAGHRVAHLGDNLVDLVPGKLAAFAGLCSLRHLDLHHVGVDEVFRRHAETARGDLLDRGAHGVAVRHRLEAVGLLAAFAGIRLAADAVHGDRERGMRFARDRAERHRPGGEAAHDVLCRFDLLDRDRLAAVLVRRLEPEQAADGEEALGLLVA